MEEADLTRGQVARLLDVSPERVRQLTVTGRLRCRQTPLGRLYSRADVEAVAAARAEAPK